MILANKGFEAGFSCISLIGMAGAGKTTVGAALARELAWAFLDTDFLMEALYATRLQDITDALPAGEFLDLEAGMIEAVSASHCVIATGGSVVYRPRAMEKLNGLGPVIYIHADFPQIEKRIAEKPERGLVMDKGQTLASIYAERQPLYEKYSCFTCDSGLFSVGECIKRIIGYLNGIKSECDTASKTAISD